jgi:HicB-like antitoxin of HicAB toxin-antitoxin system
LPGAFGAGSTTENAIIDAMGAAREWCVSQTSAKQPLPAPRNVLEVIRDKASRFDPASGEAVVMLNVVIERGRMVKANASLDAGTLEAIDAEAASQGLTRSAFLASAELEKIDARR